jgi:hypothetical protein
MGRAMQEPGVEPLLELGDHLGRRWLADAKLGGRLAKRAQVDQANKEPKGLNTVHTTMVFQNGIPVMPGRQVP